MNRLYFGDNLDIMKQLYHQERKSEFIDLVYIDPPFNSKRNYNVLFESVEMDDTKAQKEAFSDTWSNVSYVDTFNEIAEIDNNLYRFLKALDSISISKSAISYLATMGIRIWYIHKLLKPTGSFYLHCDSTMSHYLKIVCDLIFGEKNFRNEIIWQRTTSGKSVYKNLPRNSDAILWFTKTNLFMFIPIVTEFDKEYSTSFNLIDEDGRGPYNTQPIISPSPRPNLSYIYIDNSGKEWKSPLNGWRFNFERMKALENDNRLLFTKSTIREKYYLNERKEKGKQLSNIWTDIPIITQSESLGYPTQKPAALMERIIQASSNQGDVVADFFCGCGTTIAAAQKLNRQWIGSDISHLAIKLISKRLVDTYGDTIKSTFEIHGFPKDLASAKELAAKVKGGRLLFEEWIVEVMLHGILNEKRNTMGYDGHFTFDQEGKKTVALIEVKSGGANPAQLNHFIRTMEEQKSHLGIFVCFEEEVTDNMRRIAKQYGKDDRYKYDLVQIITVQEILAGKQPDRPASRVGTFKQAERKIISDDRQQKLEL